MYDTCMETYSYDNHITKKQLFFTQVSHKVLMHTFPHVIFLLSTEINLATQKELN